MIKMTTIITVEQIAQCRTRPDNDIDLLAVYGGHITEHRQKPSYKVNPLYSDTLASNPDINGNTRSLQVVTYETFPRTKETVYKEEDFDNSDTKSTTSAIIPNGGVHVTQNTKHRSSYVYDDQASSLESTESCESNISQGKDADLDVSVSTANSIGYGTDNSKVQESLDSNKNVPVLLGPVINDTQHSHSSSNSPNMVAGDISSPLTHTQTQEALRPIRDVRLSPVTDVYSSVKKVKFSAGYQKNYEVLKAEDVTIEIEKKDVKSVANGTCKPQKEDSGVENETVNSDLLGYDNKAFEINENVKNTEKGKDYRHRLQRQNSFDSDRDCEYAQIVPESVNQLQTVSGKDNKPVACEIQTEAMVHVPNGTGKCNHEEYSGDVTKCSCSGSVKTADDWPDIDQIVRPSTGTEDHIMVLTQGHPVGLEQSDISNRGVRRARSVSDTVQSDSSHTVSVDKDSSGYKKKKKHVNGNTKAISASQNGSTRTLKSILTNGSNVSQCDCSNHSTQRASDSDSEIHEMKTVKFSKDTVFNENKTNKYKQEKVSHINLREIYCGKIASDSAIAKMNPLYKEDELRGTEGDGQGSLTDDEKLAYQISLKNALKMSKEKGETFNQPSYMERYLILKAHGLKEDDDVEKLPEWIERPTYNRLIHRTLAKERRKCCVKWTFVLLTVMAITAIAVVLGIYFKNSS